MAEPGQSRLRRVSAPEGFHHFVLALGAQPGSLHQETRLFPTASCKEQNWAVRSLGHWATSGQVRGGWGKGENHQCLCVCVSTVPRVHSVTETLKSS